MIEVNLLGQIYGAKAALPYMKKNGGALIHVTSVEAIRTAPYQSAYGASKHGVHGFLQVLRVELAHDEIPVSVTEILPAAINTPIYEKGRNKMPFKMRPVPPIYHPQVVTDAILYAAENPVRDVVAGGAGLGVVYAERVSPQIADFFTETIGFIGQKGGEKDSAEQFKDNLFAPDFRLRYGRRKFFRRAIYERSIHNTRHFAATEKLDSSRRSRRGRRILGLEIF